MFRPRPLRAALAAAFAAGALFAFAAPALAADDAVIRVRDRCDPASFNAVLGAGACVGRDGKSNMTFDQFIGTLTAEQRVIGWRFKPRTTHVMAGQRLKVRNIGGETHTFTMVERFGGGFVDILNQLTGMTTLAPECATMAPDGSLVPQPPSATNRFIEAGAVTRFSTGPGSVVPTGTSHWECCIHPWMKATVVVG